MVASGGKAWENMGGAGVRALPLVELLMGGGGFLDLVPAAWARGRERGAEEWVFFDGAPCPCFIITSWFP